MKSLFSAFEKQSKAKWVARVEKDLKGKPLESLDWKINESLHISPFAHAEDLEKLPIPLVGKRKNNAWEKGVRILVRDVGLANKAALVLLEKGADALCFQFEKVPTQRQLKKLLQDIELEWISTHFILPKKSWKSTATNFVKIITDRGLDEQKINGSFQFLKLTNILEKDFEELDKFSFQLPNFRFITINTLNYYNGTEQVVSELAQSLREVNDYLEKWNEKDLDLKKLAMLLQLSVQLDDSYFINIAKIRALKLLWELLLKSWKVSKKIDLAIETHLNVLTQTPDENYNKIKATSQATAAVIGGSQRLFIHASDEFKDEVGTENANRLALNIQHIMQVESYLDKVVDPAAGSYYLENLTDTIAEAAWEEFKKTVL